MGEGTLLRVVAIAQVLQLVSCNTNAIAAAFFHEQSRVAIIPHPAPEGFSDFGFAMGYRSAPRSLVVGAPRETFLGKVYSCDISRAYAESQIKCTENKVDFESLAKYSRDLNPSQYFYMGSTIAATSNYSFSCAPLWTSNVSKPGRREILSEAFGTCFMINDTSTYRYRGTLERYLSHRGSGITKKSFIGGTGWSTLVDEENDLLLIVKTSLNGDFVYTPISKPLMKTKSLVLPKDPASQEMARFLVDHWNIGYGITAGKFFVGHKTVYPFSMEMKKMEGAISFLEYDSAQNLLSIMYESNSPYKLTTTAIGTMFGSAMGAADLNMDGLDELLVGAPAESEDDCVECGALHIYLGGDVKTLELKDRLRTILGTAKFGRFGSAITASDLDSDGISEIVVSAPYEDEGRGAIYILSGYELYRTIIRFKVFRCISVSDLELTQKIQQEHYRQLGFSLQFIPDIDENGCSELVAGAPGNGSALLFKCMSSVNVTVMNELIARKAKSFTVEVCAQVQLNQKPQNIVGEISVLCSSVGNDTLLSFDISCDNCVRDRKLCKNITMLLNDLEPGDYTFTSRAVQLSGPIYSSKDFSSSWVVASPYSRLMDNIVIPRDYRGKGCVANLSLEFLWSGSKKHEYVLGSTVNETVTILIHNHGNESCTACAWLRVSGAPVTHVGCRADNYEYSCYFPKPVLPNAEYPIDLVLDMTQLTNIDHNLLVEASLRENCNQENIKVVPFEVEYKLTTDNISINGISHNRNITDTQVYNNETIFDIQEYVIKNNGKITWKNVYASIVMEHKPFMTSFKVSTDSSKCDSSTDKNSFIFLCTLNLEVNSTQKITATTEILAQDIKPGVLYNDRLNITSKLTLHLYPTGEIKKSSLMTVMKFEKERTFAHNKLFIILIAVLVALIILAILIIILYRMGFFRRKQKQRLHVLRESIKQKNSRRNTHVSSRDEPTEGLQMDVDEDPFDEDPFDEIPIEDSVKDDIVLVEETGQDAS